MKNNSFPLSIVNGVFFYLCATGSAVLLCNILKNAFIYFEISPLLNFTFCQAFKLAYLISFCLLFFRKTKSDIESLRSCSKTLLIFYIIIKIFQFGSSFWIDGFIVNVAYESWQSYHDQTNILAVKMIDAGLTLLYILILPLYVLRKQQPLTSTATDLGN